MKHTSSSRGDLNVEADLLESATAMMAFLAPRRAAHVIER
jgi:hypothetical protein